MIVNPSAVTPIQIEWQGVIRMRERIGHLVLSTFAFDVSRSPAFGDVLYNLPFLLAIDVLKQVLLQAREDGQFTGSGSQLGDLIDSAKSSIPWVDWQCLREGVQRRNEVVQYGRLFGDVQSLRAIADVEAQLVNWGIITAASS